ncbi:hypothetical protein FQN57_004772 [Myotisia sp. PD_48]|nr:hypothetical protein FQN57_004772 [Myotisia sp. PD_48]
MAYGLNRRKPWKGASVVLQRLAKVKDDAEQKDDSCDQRTTNGYGMGGQEGDFLEPGEDALQIFNPELKPIHPRQEPSNPRQNLRPTVVMTVVQIVLPNGSTIASFVVPTLPATVSNSHLGVVTIPVDSASPVVISSIPIAAETGSPTSSPTQSNPSNTIPTAAETVSPTSSPSQSNPSNTIPTAAETVSPTSPPASSPSNTVPVTSSQDRTSSGRTSTPISSPSIPAPSSVPASIPAPSQEPVPPTSGNLIVSTPPETSTEAGSFQSSSATEAPALIPPPLSSSSLPSTASSASDNLIPSSTAVNSNSRPDVTSNSSTNSSTISRTNSNSPIITSTTAYSTTSTSSSSTSSRSSLETVTLSSTSGFVPGGGAGGGNPTDGSNPKPTTTDSAASGENGPSVSVPKLVGGIVGGVAGIVLVIMLIMLILRFRKRKPIRERNITSGLTTVGIPSATTSTMIVSDRSNGANTGNRLSSAIFGVGRAIDRWRDSGSLRAEEIAPTQRGFQKLGGRKITSVLESGGDGYDDRWGESYERRPEMTSSPLSKEVGTGSLAAGAYFSRGPLHKEAGMGDSRDAPSPPFDRPESAESVYSERIVIRPSPARTPVATSAESFPNVTISPPGRTGMFAPFEHSRPAPPIHTRSGRDGIGRSLASADTSRTSRFTEGI